MKKNKNQSEYHDIKLTNQKNIIWRRLVYGLFIVFFLIITPIIIIYTQGYRYNFKRGKIQKTGILIISSIPKKADVYLNNNIIEGDTTPTRIEKLLPNDYSIKLTKEGYHDWQKKLQVVANNTTFAEDIILWKYNLPIQLASYDITNWLNSPDRKKIAINTKSGKIIYFELNENKLEQIHQGEKNSNINIIDWSNTGKKLLINDNKKYIVIDVDRTNRPKTIINSRNYTTVKWDTENDNILYGLNESGIWQIDLFKNKAVLISKTLVSDFIIDNNTIYSFNKNIIYQQEISDQTKPKILDDLRCESCYFINNKFKKLILLDPDHQSLSIIDPVGLDKPITKSAKSIAWLNDDTFLFYNDWEIWIMEVNKSEPELVTRIGSNITKAVWHNDGRHIIFASENKIKIIELDNRELMNVVELFSGNNIKYLDIDSDGENIYFNSIIADQENLMELNIQ